MPAAADAAAAYAGQNPRAEQGSALDGNADQDRRDGCATVAFQMERPEKAHRPGEAIAIRGCVPITGGCPGLPLPANCGARLIMRSCRKRAKEAFIQIDGAHSEMSQLARYSVTGTEYHREIYTNMILLILTIYHEAFHTLPGIQEETWPGPDGYHFSIYKFQYYYARQIYRDEEMLNEISAQLGLNMSADEQRMAVREAWNDISSSADGVPNATPGEKEQIKSWHIEQE